MAQRAWQEKGALSSAWMFEMAAGAWWCSSVACGGKGFCVAIWLAMAMALVTKATQNFELEGQLLENSISKKCTYMNHLDECSFSTRLDEHMGIAGLALNSRCMLPWKVETERSVADHLSTCKEPNSFNMPHCEMRTDWEDEMFQHGRSLVTAFHPSMDCLDARDHFQYHSGILNNVEQEVFQQETLSLSLMRVCNFQCNAGNFDSVGHRAIAGDFNAWFVRDRYFQCNAADMTHSAVQIQRGFHRHGFCNEIDLTSDARSLHGSNLHSFSLTTECDMDVSGLNDSVHFAHDMNKLKEVSVIKVETDCNDAQLVLQCSVFFGKM